MAERTPPPGGKKPGLMIAIGIPKGGRTPPPGMPSGKEKNSGSPDNPGSSGARASREAAHFIPENRHCKDCSNWDPTTGDCSEVEGSFGPEDACITYFKAGEEASEPSDNPQEESQESALEGAPSAA